MTPKKLPSSGMKRGASLPPKVGQSGSSLRQRMKDHTKAVRCLLEVFQAPQAMDLDILDLEAQQMRAAGIPAHLLPPRIDSPSMDGGNPFPAGRSV